jgi:hypothetical protein
MLKLAALLVVMIIVGEAVVLHNLVVSEHDTLMHRIQVLVAGG